jgi:peptidyl-prolyl cis-trans isomerase C
MTPNPELTSPVQRQRGFLAAALRDPLTHFIVLGVLLFAGASMLEAMRHPVVRITQGDVDQLAASWAAMSMRPPTETEMRGLLQERIDEEVLAREAHRMGLDEDDVIIRRRLAQKMAFISDDVAILVDPTEADLRAFFETHRDQFNLPARYSWRHVVFGADRPGDSETKAASDALASSRRGADPVGDPSLVPSTFSEAPLSAIEGEFGRDVATTIEGAAEGVWTGPVVSPFGVHLIRVEQRLPPTQATYEDVTDLVREAWLAAERDKRNAEMRAQVRKRYRIVFEDGVPSP